MEHDAFTILNEEGKIIEDWKDQAPNPLLNAVDNILRLSGGSTLNPQSLRLRDFEIARVVLPHYFIPVGEAGGVPIPDLEELFVIALRGFGQSECYGVKLVLKPGGGVVWLREVSNLFKKWN